MDFTIQQSWYNQSKGPLSTGDPARIRMAKSKGISVAQTNTSFPATDELTIARSNPAPSRLRSTHIQRLESLASKAEQDKDEENQGIERFGLIPTNVIQGSDFEVQKLVAKFPMEMTFEESMKSYSPPTKRSRWADMFESRRSENIGTSPSFFTNTLRGASPPSFLKSALQRTSPTNFSLPRKAPPNSTGATANSSLPIRIKLPPKKKVPGSDDSNKFRAFLARGDAPMPFFISATGTHQQFFPISSRPTPTHSLTIPSNMSHPLNNSFVSSIAFRPSNDYSMVMNNSRGPRSSASASTRTNTNHSSNTVEPMWSAMERGLNSSASQLTDNTRMTSASGSFADHSRMPSAPGSFCYQPSIGEDQQMFHGYPMISSPPEVEIFTQESAKVFSAHELALSHGKALVATTPPPSSAPISMAIRPMIIPPTAIALDNMLSPFPDLSHLVTKFRPTNMLLREQGVIPDNSRQDTNYEGDENHPDLLGLPISVNCCMWIINIPPDVKHGEFMRVLNCGAIAALSMVPPQKGHTTQAAKATFKKVSGGAELYRRARRGQGLRVRRNKIKVWYNDYGAYEWRGPETRFLEIEAPAVLDENFWQAYFGNWCKFEFVRIAGQAQTCFQAIQKDDSFLGQVKVQYGIDPDEF